ncbi:T9SS type A sorting domain-containing protein, partial [Bacteroidia bacterium]|nr:T9SS type A sorting domain-containing protein [Bacteroidia bacterium]
NQKVSSIQGGFDEALVERDYFGYGVAGVGDYNGDGIPDVATTTLSTNNKSLYVIYLNRDGTVKGYVKSEDITAQGLTAIGDINGDGRVDLVACDPTNSDGGRSRGAISILFLDNVGKVDDTKTVTISSTQGGLGAGLQNSDQFGGREVAMLGDLDKDGTLEMAVGAFGSDNGKGAVWILSLNATTYQVESKIKITEGMNGFNDTLTDASNPNGTSGASFGHAMCAAGDLNGDGVPDLITGANQQNEGNGYILYLNSNKTVKTYTKITDQEGGFGLSLEMDGRFSRSISFMGDLRGDGTIAVNMGGGVARGGSGSLYVLFFKPCTITDATGYVRWQDGNTLFTNWSHRDQALTSDSLSFEQCVFKSFETQASQFTYNYNDGRCICIDSNARLVESTELSNAYTNECLVNGGSVSVNELTHNPNVSLYPNPTTGRITLTHRAASFTASDRVMLFSITGKLLHTQPITRTSTSIDLSAQPNGVYVASTQVGGLISIIRVIKR